VTGRRNLKRLIAAFAAALLIGSLAGWVFYSPERIMHHLRMAAVRGDTDELAEWIDISAVRRSAKHQARLESRGMAARERRELDGLSWKDFSAEQKAFAYRRAEVEAAVSFCSIDLTIDEWLTIADMGGLLLNGRPGLPIATGENNQPTNQPKHDWHIERHGLNEFRAIMPEEIPVIVVFKRTGLGWKVKDLRMPKGGLAPWATVEPPSEGWSADFKPKEC
jgi:hypothetical protein